MARREGIEAEFFIKGDEEMKRKLASLATEMQTRGAAALNDVMSEELEEMKNRTPVLSGKLQSTGRVVPAVVNTEEISVGVRFGEGIDYALVQHERYWYQHDDGQPLWVWTTLDQSKPFIVSRVTRKLFPS